MRTFVDHTPRIAVVGYGRMHGFDERVAVHPFDESLSHLGYAASDFVLMPSKFEPCGLPQMIGPLYGSLPVVHDTGGIHDTVQHLDIAAGTGNGFMFKFYDAPGLRWAIDQAMAFHALPEDVRNAQISRIMKEAKQQFTHEAAANSELGGALPPLEAAAMENLPSEMPLAEALRQGMDAYLAFRGQNRTVIAGYPWFLDWGRDTLICLWPAAHGRRSIMRRNNCWTEKTTRSFRRRANSAICRSICRSS